MKKLFNSKLLLQVIIASMVATLATAGIVGAATTIGSNINTAGTLTATGATTIYGATSVGGAITATSTLSVTSLATLLGGATTTSITLLNGETISNTADGVISLMGIASTTSISLTNGETITNATNGAISFNDANLVTTGTLGAAATTLSSTLSVASLATLLGGATTTSLTLLNGETISNTTDGVIAITSPSTTFSGDVTITGDDLTMTINTLGALLVADGTNFNPVVMSGDATIAANGALTVAADAIGSSEIAANTVAMADLVRGTNGQIIVANTDADSAYVSMSGDATIAANGALTVANSAVIGKVLTGYVAGAGTVAATDSILQAIQKLDGNDATNANLTGIVTSTGNTTAIADKAISYTKLADGTDGNLITWDASGVAALVVTGNAGEVLTSGGAGVAPTFQAVVASLNNALPWTALQNLDAGIAVDTSNFTVNGTTGAVHTAGDFDIATNKFTVVAASGNTLIAGTLGVTGAITGNVTGNVSGTAATVTDAAQTNITSVGTLTGLTMGGNLAMGANSITGAGAINFATASSTGLATFDSIKVNSGVGGTALTKITVGNLADDASGWTPNGALVAFTITADAASVGANSLISISTGVDAAVTGSCFVRSRTATVNFVITCTVAPTDGATLQYMIVN